MNCVCCDRPTPDMYVDEGGEPLCEHCARAAEGQVFYVDGRPVEDRAVLLWPRRIFSRR